MLARLTRNLLSPGRFQSVLYQPFKWYALKEKSLSWVKGKNMKH